MARISRAVIVGNAATLTRYYFYELSFLWEKKFLDSSFIPFAVSHPRI